MKLHTLMAGLAAAGLSPFLTQESFAQENLLLAEAYVPGLADTVFVTAARAPQSLKDTLASTTIITREQIEKSQSQDMYQLLKSVAGVNIRRSGGRGSQTTLSIRGGDAAGVLVLVNGVNIESATLGQAEIERLEVDQIERIEILRGPKSSLYGSQAMYGVVHIFTRSVTGKNGVTYSGEAGSDQTRSGTVSANGASDTSRINLTASYTESEGFDSRNSDDDSSGIDTYDLDDDGYRRVGVSVNVEQDFGQYWVGNALYRKTEIKSEYDGSGITLPFSMDESQVSALGLALGLEKFQSRLQYAQSEGTSVLRNDVQSADFRTEFGTRRQTGSLENSFAAFDWANINFGADYVHEEIMTSTEYALTARDVFGGYVNSQMSVGEFSWGVGFRHDEHENLGNKWTGDTVLGWEFLTGVTATISYGTGFKAPSFNDLFYPLDVAPWGTYVGNPDLLPEESESYEIGVDAYRSWGMVSVRVYKTYVENLIDWREVEDYNTAINVAGAKLRGAEIQLGTEEFGISWMATVSYQKSTDSDSGQDLDRRPRRQFSLNADKQFERFSFGATLYAQSAHFDGLDDDLDQRVTAGHGQVDIRVGYVATPQLKLRARIDNVFDNDFEEIAGFNNEGRFYLVGFDYTPQ